MDSVVILVIVFVSVLALSMTMIPAILSNAQSGAKGQKSDDVLSKDRAHFFNPDNRQQMSYTLVLVVGACSLIAIIITRFYLGFALAVLLMTLAYMVPGWVIKRRAARRDLEIDSGMLDFTLLTVNALRSGMALPSALELAGKNTGGTLGEVFGNVLQEHSLGLDLGDAIERLATRVNSENLQLFSATVCVSMRTGGSMADVLNKVVETIRQRSALDSRLKTLTSRTNFEVMLMAVSPLAAFVLLYLIDENLMMPLVTTQLGWCAILCIVVWETIGFFVMKYIAKVKA